MSIVKRYKDKFLEVLHDRPITTAGTYLVAVWMIWTSCILFVTATRPVTMIFAHGPGILLPAATWAVIFLIVGVLKLAEIFWLNHPKGALVFQVFTLAPIFLWSVSWFLGAFTPGEPAYAFVLLVALGIPFVTRIANRVYVSKLEHDVDVLSEHEDTSAPSSSTTTT